MRFPALTRAASAAGLCAIASLAIAAAPADWRARITAHDRVRLHDWRGAWITALARAEAAGAGPRLAAEGALFVPDAALEGPPPPDGDYRCRVFKLGAQAAGGHEFAVFPGFHCRLAGGRFTKVDGVQRPNGRLYPYDGARLLFLGTMALGDEAGILPYARDPDRDMIGVFERIGPRRWRLVLPHPRWESLLDVIELVPAAS